MLWGMASTSALHRAPLPVGYGDMIRAARYRAGMSARALGRAVGRSHPWVTDLEDGVRPPSATMADRVSRALGLDPWTDAVLRSAAVDDEPAVSGGA
ncbi:multiprotein-bridging factor 1 family protein [Streptomyces sp. NPDC058459]|uniref:helix-turn-helix domain-containing protein n=1 Tax=Streptomyces sp. NPDC058459 TaxID=3346508 RepID=UPI00364D433E